MRKIITTVGTSLFTNFQQDEVKNKYGRDYASIAIGAALTYITDKKPKSGDIYNVAYKHHIQSIQENIEDYWFGGEFPNNQKASAEIASIIEIAKEEPSAQFEVHLLATDTLLSVLAAEMISNWFHQHKPLAPNIKEVVFQRTQPDFQRQEQSNYVVKDLRTDNQNDYESGIMNLLDVLNKITTQDTVLNITGGYKAIVPIVTVWAQIKKVSIKYLFNENELEASSILTLKELPLNFDWEFVEAVGYVLNEAVRSALDQENESDALILNLLDKNRLVNETRDLTALGKLIQQYLTTDGQPTANNILGLFIEYKLFELFQNNKCFDVQYQPSKVSIFKECNGSLTDIRTEANKDSGYCEIDLLLGKPDSTFVLGEVKTYNLVKDGLYTELEEKISKYLEFKENATISEVWLIVVSPSLKLSLGEWYNNPRDNKYKSLLRMKQQMGNRFRAFSYQFNLSSGKLNKGIAAVNTKNLLQIPIDPDELIEINLQ